MTKEDKSDHHHKKTEYGETIYYNEKGEIHRDNDLPAIELTDGTKKWRQNGKRFRANDLPTIEWGDGNKWWVNEDGDRHRLTGPAVIYSNGDEEYYINRKYYTKENWVKEVIRTQGYHHKVVDFNGTIRYYDENNKYHRENNLPAIEWANDWAKGSKSYYQHGKFFRENDLPTEEENGSKKWFINNGDLHRLTGPAIIHYDGTEEYYINGGKLSKDNWDYEVTKLQGYHHKVEDPKDSGYTQFFDKDNKLHNDKGPAIIYGDKYPHAKEYHIHGKLHNIMGPAVINEVGNYFYYLNDVHLSKEEWEAKRVFYFKNCLGFTSGQTENSYAKLNDDPNLPTIQFKDIGFPFRLLLSIDPHYSLNFDMTNAKLWLDNDLPHNLNGPALILGNGEEHYYIKGKELSKEDWEKNKMPEDTSYHHKDTVNGSTYYYNEKNEIHRDNDLPAIEASTGRKEWFQNNKRHRKNNPAVTYKDGIMEFYQNGVPFRENDLPTDEYPDNRKYWYNENIQLHRLNGPAIIYSDGSEKYYIEGKEYNKEDWQIEVNKICGIKETNSTPQETNQTQPKKEKQTMSFNLFDKDRLAQEAQLAAMRVAAEQITDLVTKQLAKLIGKQMGDTKAGEMFATAFVKTDFGKALISTVIGNALPNIPKLQDNAIVDALASEFRINGMATAGNQLATLFMDELVPGVMDIIDKVGAPKAIPQLRVHSVTPPNEDVNVSHLHQVGRKASV